VPGNGEGPGGHRGLTSNIAHNLNRPQRTTLVPESPPVALATVYLVHTTRGGLRALLLVDCPLPGCGHVHQHRAPVDFTSGRRKAGCGGAYLVHAGAVEAGCAA